jgi:hypothetical protein
MQAEPTDGACTEGSIDRSGESETYRTGPGSAYHLLFGDDQERGRQTVIPNLNEICQGAELEIELTQNAPHPNE